MIDSRSKLRNVVKVWDRQMNLLWEEPFSLRYPFLKGLQSAFPDGEVYLVGGAVRDLLSGRSTKDHDFLVRGIAAPDLAHFLDRHGNVNWVGKTFGVYKFMPADMALDEPIDIALPRTERSFSLGGAYRDFLVKSDPHLSVEEDLGRRDFTVNAMAADLTKRCLIDPFGGLDDLKAGRLRAVGEPSVRFAEDASRILRGLRFACQLKFHFEPATWAALCEAVGLLIAKREDGGFVVPRETIAKEWIKAMVADPVTGFDLWDKSGAFEKLIPELIAMKGCPQPLAFHTEGDVWNHTRLALMQLASPAFCEEFHAEYDAELVLATLLHDIGKPPTLQTPERDGADRIRFNNHDKVGARLAKEIATRLKLPAFPKGSRYSIDVDTLGWLVEKHLLLVHGDIDRMRAATIEKHFLNPACPGVKLLQLIFCDGMATVPPDGAPQLTYYRQVRERIGKIEEMSRERSRIPPPLLTGDVVMEILHLSPGPSVGEYLALLREEQLSGRLANPKDAIAFLKKQLANEGDVPL